MPLLACAGAGWAQLGKLAAAKGGDKAQSAVAENRRMFQAQVAMGQGNKVEKLDSMHQNMVCSLQYFSSSYAGTAAEFTTSGLDGKIVFWTRDQLSKAMAGLEIS